MGESTADLGELAVYMDARNRLKLGVLIDHTLYLG